MHRHLLWAVKDGSKDAAGERGPGEQLEQLAAILQLARQRGDDGEGGGSSFASEYLLTCEALGIKSWLAQHEHSHMHACMHACMGDSCQVADVLTRFSAHLACAARQSSWASGPAAQVLQLRL